jgi:DNA-binding HxlR family transcriptional regulator
MADKQVSCLVETTLAVIGGRWKVLILQQLFPGVKRFNELYRALAGITHKTLTQQLREMEADGIISRKVYPQIPPKVEYSLTPLGRTLKPVLTAMHNWAARHGAGFEGRNAEADVE